MKRIQLVPILAALVGLMAAAPPAFAQNESTVARAQSTASSVTDTPRSNRCINAGHQNPCWATLLDISLGHVGNSGCSSDDVPEFNKNNVGIVCWSPIDLVEIGCYYHGQPQVNNDDLQDHVVEEFDGITQSGLSHFSSSAERP